MQNLLRQFVSEESFSLCPCLVYRMQILTFDNFGTNLLLGMIKFPFISDIAKMQHCIEKYNKLTEADLLEVGDPGGAGWVGLVGGG